MMKSNGLVYINKAAVASCGENQPKNKVSERKRGRWSGNIKKRRASKKYHQKDSYKIPETKMTDDDSVCLFLSLWRWLPRRMLKRQVISIIVFLKTSHTRTIIPHLHRLHLGSDHSLSETKVTLVIKLVTQQNRRCFGKLRTPVARCGDHK